jgi:hypothetical protein
MRWRASVPWLGLCWIACATGPEISGCPPRSEQKPAPTLECLGDETTHVYLQDAAADFADRLMGWHSHPGTATVSIEFAAGANVESVCLRETSGDRVGSRARRAAVRVWKLPVAPACLAGRRIEFSWESPDVTREHVRAASWDCKDDAAAHMRAIDFCEVAQHCQQTEFWSLRDAADRVHSQCVLKRLPIAITVADPSETVFFLPVEGAEPDAQDALDALASCDNAEDRSVGVSCMLERGWGETQ